MECRSGADASKYLDRIHNVGVLVDKSCFEYRTVHRDSISIRLRALQRVDDHVNTRLRLALK